MLVLTRRVGEQIVIGRDIRITVVDVGGNKVRLGVTAPAEVRVDRQEVHEQRLKWQAGEASMLPAGQDACRTAKQPT